jgi:nitroreductase
LAGVIGEFMDFIELVKKRQSVRKYLAKPVSRDLIEKCIDAARLSPSACNSQPWSFVAADNEKTKNDLARAALTGIYSMNSFSIDAPVIIAVITERSRFSARLGGFFQGTQYSLIDIGIACEHLCLMASALGLGTCMLGWFNEKAVKKTLKLTRSSKIDVLITLGYPAIEQTREKNRMPLSEILHYR